MHAMFAIFFSIKNRIFVKVIKLEELPNPLDGSHAQSGRNLRNGVSGDFVTLAVNFLNGRVVAVFVRNEESGLDVAAIGILALTVEHFLVQINVVVVDGVVESDHNHLRDLLRLEFARDFSTGFGAKAVGKKANSWVARGCAVRIRIQI